MPLAIVSDIHGNLTALDAVIADLERRGVDRVLHGGDLALAGCQPAEVIDRIRELGWPGVVGNTDELLWRPDQLQERERAAPKLRAQLRLLFTRYRPATLELIGEERLAWLRSLPAELREGDLVLLHASPGDLWRAPLPDAGESELIDTYRRLGARTAVYGHIHLPYIRELEGLTVINTGSVGAPHDGDPRASYLLIESGGPRTVRVPYDVEREAELLLRSDYPEAQLIAATRREGRFQPPPPDSQRISVE